MAPSVPVLAPVLVEKNEAVLKTFLTLGDWAPNKGHCKLLISEIGRTNAHSANIIRPAMASPRAQGLETSEERKGQALRKLHWVAQMS